MSEHTQGPWRFLEADDHDSAENTNRPLTIVGGPGNCDLASVYSRDDATVAISREEAIANAILIASAPTMLKEIERLRAELVEERHAVLELQREFLGPLPSGNKTRLEEEVERLRAAVVTAKREALEEAAKVAAAEADAEATEASARHRLAKTDEQRDREGARYQTATRIAAAIRALSPLPAPPAECICPKCGLRHGGSTLTDSPF